MAGPPPPTPHDSYEPNWIKHFKKGEYYAALECMILNGEGTSEQMNAISALLIAQAVGHLKERFND
jgi:hypothetical protein